MKDIYKYELVEAKELDSETAKKLLETAQGKLELTEDLMKDAKAKLEKIVETINPELFEELSELKKLIQDNMRY